MSDIVCVTNRKLCQGNFLARIERIASCHPAGIILREKDVSPMAYEKLAAIVMKICGQYGVTCILHSFSDVAASLHADAIHLPLRLLQELPQEEKARFAILGASCHSVEDALRAQALGCTYISAGHVFETDCKKGLPGRGLGFLHDVCAAVDIPVFGIGGIDAETVDAVRRAGAMGVCVMSGFMTTGDVAGFMRAMEAKRGHEAAARKATPNANGE